MEALTLSDQASLLINNTIEPSNFFFLIILLNEAVGTQVLKYLKSCKKSMVHLPYTFESLTSLM